MAESSGRRGLSCLRVAAETVAVLISVAITAAATLPRGPVGSPLPVWSAASGSPAPLDFRVLMFPVHPGVAIRGGDGEPIGTLDRAMANSLEELDQEAIALRLPDSRKASVARADLALLPPSHAPSLIEAWRESWAARMSDARHAKTWARIGVNGRGETEVELQLATSGETNTWTYRTDGSTVVPLEFSSVNSKAAAFAELSADLSWAVKVGAVAIIGGIAWLVFRGVRARPKSTK